MKGPLHIFILLCSCISSLSAQAPFFKIHTLDELHKNAKPELIFEDQNSALWFGTTEGLFLYDGIEFHPFLKDDTTSNHVRSIFRDSKNRLWIGYEDGSISHFKKQKLQLWQPQEGLPRVAVNGFVEDRQGNIWISTYGEGIYCYGENRMFNFNGDDGLPSDDVNTMVLDHDGKVWVGTDRGMSACTFNDGEKNVEDFTIEDGLPDNIVQAILVNGEGQLWVGTYDGGVCLFDPKEKSFTYPFPDQSIGVVTCLELFGGTDLWIGTMGNGIWRYSLRQKQLDPLAKFENAKVADLHRDIEGNIWTMTNSGGIYSANRQFEFIATEFDDVQAVLSDSKNRLWVGTKDGLFIYRPDKNDKNNFEEQLPNLKPNTLSLFEDEFGNIWIGTFGKGILVHQPSTGKIHQLSLKNGLKDGNIFSIDGSNGVVWVATLSGAVEIKYTGDIFKEGKMTFNHWDRTKGLGSNFIYKVFIDSQQRVWFGTDGKGVSLYKNGTIKTFSIATHTHAVGQEEDDGSQLQAVYSITEDKNGHIWLSTDESGIYEFDGENFNHLTVKEGIRDLEITSLATDANGQIIVVHPTGLDVLTPETKHLIYYDDEVGVHELDPNLNAICTDQFGNIWIGGKYKVIKYTALKEKLEIHPRTLLNNVFVYLEPIDFQQTSSFDYDQNHLVFSYMGLWYTDPQIVKYRYRLQGYDLQWIESKDRRATYSNLPPGDYTFQVTSTENDAWSNEPIINYSFKINSPIWMQGWFALLLVVIVGSLFYWYQKSRDNRIQLVNLLEKDKAESKLAALKAQINPHFLFNSFNTLVSVIEENPKLAVEYVDNLSDFYRKIMQLRDKEIIPIHEEIELVNNYYFLLQKRYGKNFHLNINLNGQKYYIVPFTLQILVENAVKHNIISKSKPLTVNINLENEEQHIVVTNDIQPKLTKEKSTHFGLHSIVQGYKLLGNKKVKVEDDGQVFKVSIPVIE